MGNASHGSVEAPHTEGCALDCGARNPADQPRSERLQGSSRGVASAGQWLPKSFGGQRATVSRHPAWKPRQGERHERANEVLRWRGVYPDPQPALAPAGLLPISPSRDRSRRPRGGGNRTLPQRSVPPPCGPARRLVAVLALSSRPPPAAAELKLGYDGLTDC